jgi:CRISPR-associated protein Cmr3
VWKFEALDTLFFRDSRPMNAGETVWIESQFPPTGRTLQGAIRTSILNHIGVPFKDYLNKKLPEHNALRGEIGDGDSMGRLSLTGPLLFMGSEPLFPVPLDLVKKSSDGVEDFLLLKPADSPTPSDLGNIRFPALPEGKRGYKPLSAYYVDNSGMEMLLKSAPDAGLSDHLFPLISRNTDEKPLAFREHKMGLARDNQNRTAVEGKLYAIAPVRPVDTLKIGVKVEGLSAGRYTSGAFIQRLGGEGKLAGVSVESGWTLPGAEVAEVVNRIRFKLVCITPAYMPGKGWLPAESVEAKENRCGVTWSVAVLNCSFDIIGACIGKPFKQGGWNHADRYPRKLCSYVPAGSVYFCETNKNQIDQVISLHGTKIGRHTEYGFGMVLVGRW